MFLLKKTLKLFNQPKSERLTMSQQNWTWQLKSLKLNKSSFKQTQSKKLHQSNSSRKFRLKKHQLAKYHRRKKHQQEKVVNQEKLLLFQSKAPKMLLTYPPESKVPKSKMLNSTKSTKKWRKHLKSKVK